MCPSKVGPVRIRVGRRWPSSCRRSRRAPHDPDQDKDNRKGKRTGKRSCAKAGQIPKPGNRKGCCPGLSKDARGRCAAAAPGLAPACTGLKPTTGSRTQGLQEAIDQAQTGDTLILCAGTWTLTGNSPVVIRKDLKLVGAGAGKTFLDGNNAVQVLQIDETFATIPSVTPQDLTITKGRAFFSGGMTQHVAPSFVARQSPSARQAARCLVAPRCRQMTRLRRLFARPDQPPSSGTFYTGFFRLIAARRGYE